MTEKKDNKYQHLLYEKKNLWGEWDEARREEAMRFNDDYAKALDQGKTEREFHDMAVELLKAASFSDLQTMSEVRAGDKVYRSIHGKGIFAAIVGQKAPADGFLLVGSHIDSPRLDLKPNPLYEANEQVLFKTHYYGGIKKYQWVARPLALHGVIILKDGQKVQICIGEKDEDPVFMISDLLPHLGRDQMQKTAAKVIEGESLNVLVGGLPVPEKDHENRFKLGVLALLNKEYGITERDFLSAELEIVPACKARDVGFDRSFIGAYGQDDRVCAYTSLRALLDTTAQEKTVGILLFDKEETGSDGNTGAQSELYRFAINELQLKMKQQLSLEDIQACYANTKLLSSDVCNAFDPNYPEVSEPMNSAYAGRGIGVNKYTGGGGKGGTTDCNAEYLHEVTRLFDEHDVSWQICELGKVDQGGGGTIAKYFANYGIQVLDCGVPVLSMHAPFEVTSKADVFETYRAYKCFMEHMK